MNQNTNHQKRFSLTCLIKGHSLFLVGDGLHAICKRCNKLYFKTKDGGCKAV